MPRRRRAKLQFRGQPYGARAANDQINAAGDAAAGLAGGGMAAGGAGGPSDPAALMAALAAEDPTPVPRRTARPGQPMTSGLPIGAGPGPEVLPGRAQAPAMPKQRIDVEAMASAMPMLELLANQPGASREVQVFYRQLRSQMPVDVQTIPVGSSRSAPDGTGSSR